MLQDLATALTIKGEDPSHEVAIAALHAEAFGPGRFARAAERVREEGGHDPALSFVALQAYELLGSVRMTPVVVGTPMSLARGHLLGPLAVLPRVKHQGIGRALINRAIIAAERRGSRFTLLVGDRPYYERHGFVPVEGPVMPGPVDPERVLVRWSGEPECLYGPVRHAARETFRRG